MSLSRSIIDKIHRFRRFLREFFLGMFYLDLYKDTVKFARKYNDLLNFVVLGEILGIPILSNVTTLRLIPYMYRDLIIWKVRMMRDREATDEVPDII